MIHWGVKCPRCGSCTCEWSDEELFCPNCLLQEGPEDFIYREENPYAYLDPEFMEFTKVLDGEREKEDPITERLNERLLRHQPHDNDQDESQED